MENTNLLINTCEQYKESLFFYICINKLFYPVRIIHLIILSILLVMLFPFTGAAKVDKVRLPVKPALPDSILNNIILFAPLYEKVVDSYNANLYIKGKLNLKKRNHLIRVVPSMFKIQKNVKEYMIESINEINYTSPNIYDLKVKAVNGTIPRYRGEREKMLEYFNINIYSSTLLSDKLLSPLAKNARKYYNFLLDSVIEESAGTRYKVLIIPKNKSSQLVQGYLVVNDQTWTIREIELSGKLELVKFNVKIEMGDRGDEEFLPRKFDVNLYFRFLGNNLDGSYEAFFKYNTIKLNNIREKELPRKKKYDLTESFRLTCDSSAMLVDSTHFAALRPFPLNNYEQHIYSDYLQRADTTLYKKKPKSRSRVFWGQVGDVLLSDYTLNLSRFGSVRCSPIINPLLVSYSHSNGFSYRQEFKYNRLFTGDKLLRIVPRIGYNFTRKEFYWNINADFDYWPQKRASLSIGMGNGNRIYSSRVLDLIKQVPDSVFDFSLIHLDYFKDLFFTLNHNIEVINGLNLSVGFTTHRRTSIEKSRFVAISPPTDGQLDIMRGLHETYISFAPHVRVEWTPGLYYYMSGNRKINLHSRFPTLSLDWERGLKGIFKSTGRYERIEFDLQHKVRLGLMRNLYYRFGVGAFTNQEEMFFVDFVNFSGSNLPVGWNDDIGGVFQLLGGDWYNSTREYVRGHLTYEAPFLLFRHLIKYTSSVFNERIYFNILCAPKLMPYMELGYGIGTYIFDAGIFVSSRNGKFGTVGFKFTFELFNK